MNYSESMVLMVPASLAFIINFIIMPATVKQAVHANSEPYEFRRMMLIIITSYVCTFIHAGFFIVSVLSGDVGTSFIIGVPIIALIVSAYRYSKIERATSVTPARA